MSALVRFIARRPGNGTVTAPGPVLTSVVPAPSPALVADFVRFCQGDPSVYREVLPPHLFPQWSLPMLLETAKQLPYPPLKVINVGFRLTIERPLLVAGPLAVSAQLLSVEEKPGSATLTIRVQTANQGAEVALSADLRVLVRLSEPGAKPRTSKPARPKPRVPEQARLLSSVRLKPHAGLDFAELTGDFNPIHWVPAYARAMGFKNVILHGFGTAALAYEAIGRALLSGRVERIRHFDVDFVRPLALPARVGIFVLPDGDDLALTVGDAPSGPAYLAGRVRLGPPMGSALHPSRQEM